MIKRIKYQFRLLGYAVRNEITHLPISLIIACYDRDNKL
jgi:hypothetical protein